MPKFMSRLMRNTERWPVRVSAIVGAVFLALALVAIWVGSLATSSVDEFALERQLRYGENSMKALFAGVPRDQESVTIWDDAVERTRAGDQAWMADNVGEWMATYFGFDAAYVLDEANFPVHAMRDGRTLADARHAWERDKGAIIPLVIQLRRRMAEATDGLADSSAALVDLGATDYTLIDGLPSIVSVKPIVASTERVRLAPGSEYLHVAIKQLAPEVAELFAAEYGFDEAAFLPPSAIPPDAAAPIRSADGDLVAYLTWSAYQPGHQMIQRIWPVLGLMGFVGGLVVVWLLMGIWKSSRKLDDLAFRDPLTGLANRAMFDARLKRVLDRDVALLLADLDRFKHVNDSLGHPAGDELLRQVGARIRSIVPEEQDVLVARIGGDEFAIIHTGIKQPADAQRLAAALVAGLAKPFEVDGELVFSGASVGVAMAEAGTGDGDLLRWADIALVEAKSRGRGRFVMFSPVLDEVVLQRRTIERDLRQALQNPDEIDVAYQPIFDAANVMIGAEALFRWRHPIHGSRSPSIVLKIAEERGVIAAVGGVVLHRVCELLHQTQFPWIAVNISPVQLRDPDLADLILDTATQFGIAPSRLHLEITETALMENEELTDATLARLQDAGCMIALDDFGTGYSSLSHLRRYRVDKIKIDRSFIAKLGASREDDAIVRSIISLARSMNRLVTAEGVETVQQREHLTSLGCHELQGFLLSKPLTSDGLLNAYGQDRELSRTLVQTVENNARRHSGGARSLPETAAVTPSAPRSG